MTRVERWRTVGLAVGSAALSASLALWLCLSFHSAPTTDPSSSPAAASIASFDLQAALDAAAGQTLCLPAGDYWLRDVVVSHPCHIHGAGPTLTRLHLQAGASWGIRFDVPGLRYTHVAGLSLDMGACSGIGLHFPYGLQQGRLEDLLIAGSDTGTGIALCGVSPEGKPTTNQYQTLVEGCTLYGLGIGIALPGANVDGCRPNANTIRRCTFTSNGCHVRIEEAEMNLIDGCNFNPVRAASAPRVVIVGRYSTTLLRGNYWDVIGQQMCVQQTGFGKDVKKWSLQVLGDNQPASKFVSDGRVDYRGIWSMAPGKE